MLSTRPLEVLKPFRRHRLASASLSSSSSSLSSFSSRGVDRAAWDPM